MYRNRIWYENRFQVNLPLSALAQAPTPQKLLKLIQSQDKNQSPLIPIRTTGQKIPFFYIGGSHQLLPYFDSERPVYSFRTIDLLHEQTASLTTMDEVVQYYLDGIQAVYPNGPYLLGGNCFGGMVAFAMACQLTQQGKTVKLVTMGDSFNPVGRVAERKRKFAELWQTRGKNDTLKIHQRRGLKGLMSDRLLMSQERRNDIWENYWPQSYSGRVVYFATEENQGFDKALSDQMQPGGWNDWVEGGLEIVKVPGRHETYDSPPHVEMYARKLNACLESVDESV